MSEPVSFNALHLATLGGPDQDPSSPGTTEHKQYCRPEKRFACDWPGCTHAPFTCPHNVKQHIREVHTHEKPHVCQVCDADGKIKAFARPATLYRHVREVHKMSCNGKKGRSSTKDVGPTATPTPARPTSKGNRAARPVTDPSPQTPSPTPSDMAVQMFPKDSFDTLFARAMADEWLAETGQAFPDGVFPPSPQLGPFQGRCDHCFGRSLVEDMEAHNELLHSTPPSVDGPWPLSQDLSAEEFMASLEQTSRQLDVYSPAVVQQPTPQHSPAPFETDNRALAGTGDMEVFGLELDALLDGTGLMANYGGIEEDMDFEWALSGLQ